MSDSQHDLQTSSAGNDGEKHKRRRRLQLSCGECRKKKLSCDRGLPCRRCIRSGRPHLCLYESAVSQSLGDASESAQRQQLQRNNDEIKDLRAEVTRLKSQLLRTGLHERNGDGTESTEGPSSSQDGAAQDPSIPLPATGPAEVTLPITRSPSGYYRHHSGFRIFAEVPQFYPFVKETVDEWLKPRGVHLSKIKLTKRDEASEGQVIQSLGELLPPKHHVDILVGYYIDHFAQLHRIIHIPTFKKEYEHFWLPGQTRHPAMLALIVSIISIAAWPSGISTDAASEVSQYRSMPELWVPACDRWIHQQTPKHHKLVHYQISCLTYLSKRINMLRKKRFWTETGALVRFAVFDGLHCEPSETDSPFTREMKRRIWAVIRELDLQNAMEHGLPTLLHNISSDVSAPANIDDEDFDETSFDIPPSKPVSQYTCTSYQALSAQSWELRLEISRRLLSPGFSQPLDYDDILHYTHELTQAMHSIPTWDSDQKESKHPRSLARFAHAFLQFQLKEFALTMHRPYLQRGSSKYWISENVCHHMARDVLLLNIELGELGIQNHTFFRGDLTFAATILMRLGLLQQKGSTTSVMVGLESTIQLLERCFIFSQQRYLRCCIAEPWEIIMMSGLLLQLKMHLGTEDRQTAKYQCAQQLLDLYYQRYGKPAIDPQSQPHQPLEPAIQAVAGPTGIPPVPQQLLTPGTTNTQISEWLDSSSANFGFDLFDLDTDMDGMWDPWNTTWLTQQAHAGQHG